MMHTDDRWQELREDWQVLGRAAEHFARRVARDARRFASRMEEHVGEFAGDMRRQWRCAPGAGWRGHGRQAPAEEVRRVFEDIRGVLAAVLEGVDELITDVFSRGGAEESWTRVVCNHDATCEACGRAIAAGSEAHVRGRAAERRFRCVECGVPKDAPAS